MQIFIIGYFLPLTIRTSQWPITMLLEALFVFSLHLCNDVYIQCHACSSWTLLAHIFDELQLLCFVSFEIAKIKRHENELQNLKAVKYKGFYSITVCLYDHSTGMTRLQSCHTHNHT